MTAATPDYEAARRVFARFREGLGQTEELRGEITDAMRALLTEYSTSVYENRFIAGGAVEHILGAAMRAVGIPARNRGHVETGSDIRVGTVGLSVKGCFTPKPVDIGLINTRGSGGSVQWTDPTLLVVSGIGVGYVDPVELPDATRATSDQLKLDRRKYTAFLTANPHYVAEVEIPPNPKSKATRVASYTVVEELLSRLNFNILKRFRASQQP